MPLKRDYLAQMGINKTTVTPPRNRKKAKQKISLARERRGGEGGGEGHRTSGGKLGGSALGTNCEAAKFMG